MKNVVVTVSGLVGSMIASLFGGWTASLSTLLIFMGIDFVTGLICAGIFHSSPKSKTGALESNASFKGLCRKGVTLSFVLIGHRLDLALETGYIRDSIIIAYIVTEIISIIENAELMGVHIPAILKKVIELLKFKAKGPQQEEDKDE